MLGACTRKRRGDGDGGFEMMALSVRARILSAAVRGGGGGVRVYDQRYGPPSPHMRWPHLGCPAHDIIPPNARRPLTLPPTFTAHAYPTPNLRRPAHPTAHSAPPLLYTYAGPDLRRTP